MCPVEIETAVMGAGFNARRDTTGAGLTVRTTGDGTDCHSHRADCRDNRRWN